MADRFPSLEDFDSGGKLPLAEGDPVCDEILTWMYQPRPTLRIRLLNRPPMTSSPAKRPFSVMMPSSSLQVKILLLWEVEMIF
jgi:hypothetical protein